MKQDSSQNRIKNRTTTLQQGIKCKREDGKKLEKD